MAKKLKILSVMHHVPLQSGFLAEKFGRLSEYTDMHMLVWDTKDHSRQFAGKYRLCAGRIHLGVYTKAGVIRNCLLLLYLIAIHSRVRKYILGGLFTKRMKIILRYLPVFFVKPDVIHFEFGTLAKDIEILKKLTSAKMIVSFRGYDMYYVGLDDKDYYNDVWKHTDGFHFLGKDLKQHAIKRGYTGNAIETIIPPAIDIDFFQRQAELISSNEIRIISVGRLTWRKGYDFAMQAMKFLKNKGIPFQYTIVGSGEHLQAIQFMIAEFGLESQVHLKGGFNKEQVKLELAKADVFLQSSVSEGFCNAVIEAQAMALPVVCTDAGGLPENVEDNVTGFIVPKWDAKAIADKIEWCYNNKAALPLIGKNGSMHSRNNFKIEDQVKAFIALYNKVHVS